jgi:hypothetical protein
MPIIFHCHRDSNPLLHFHCRGAHFQAKSLELARGESGDEALFLGLLCHHVHLAALQRQCSTFGVK